MFLTSVAVPEPAKSFSGETEDNSLQTGLLYNVPLVNLTCFFPQLIANIALFLLTHIWWATRSVTVATPHKHNPLNTSFIEAVRGVRCVRCVRAESVGASSQRCVCGPRERTLFFFLACLTTVQYFLLVWVSADGFLLADLFSSCEVSVRHSQLPKVTENWPRKLLSSIRGKLLYSNVIFVKTSKVSGIDSNTSCFLL